MHPAQSKIHNLSLPTFVSPSGRKDPDDSVLLATSNYSAHTSLGPINKFHYSYPCLSLIYGLKGCNTIEERFDKIIQ